MGNSQSGRAFDQSGFASARGEGRSCPDAAALGSFQLGNKRLELDDLGWGVFGVLDGVARVYASSSSEALAKLISIASGSLPQSPTSTQSVTASYILGRDLRELVASRDRLAAHVTGEGGRIDLDYFDLKTKKNHRISRSSLLVAAQSGVLTHLVLEDVSRLSRKSRDLHRILQFLEACGIEVLATCGVVSVSPVTFHPSLAKAATGQRQGADLPREAV